MDYPEGPPPAASYESKTARSMTRPAVGGLVLLAQIGGALLLRCQAFPLARHVQQGGAALPERNDMGEFSALACKLSVLFRPAWHSRLPVRPVDDERG